MARTNGKDWPSKANCRNGHSNSSSSTCCRCSHRRFKFQSMPGVHDINQAVWLLLLVVACAPVQIMGLRPFNLNLDPISDLVDTVTEKVIFGLQRKAYNSTISPDVASSSRAFASIYIDCGATEDYIDSQGNVWKADVDYSSASGRIFQECPKTIHNVAVDAELYCSERFFEVYPSNASSSMDTPSGPHGYEIPLPTVQSEDDGDDVTVSVTLHFAETFYTMENERVFDISVEGGARQTIDIVKEAQGPQRAYTITFPDVVVRDAVLSIEFYVGLEFPKICALEVHSSSPAAAAPSTTTANSNATNTSDSTSPSTSYIPGMLTVDQHGLLLSSGLTARILAVSNAPAIYVDGTNSTDIVHTDPDAGACFVDERPGNEGGWIYVSNSEAKPAEEEDDRGNVSTERPGGVGAFTFNANGELIDYRMILDEKTFANCGGGKTPWGAWISGEERKEGEIWQVDPTGVREPRVLTMSHPNPGMFESFAYDVRQADQPRFFMSKDDAYGEFRRFTPDSPDWTDPWSILLKEGTLDYLVVEPNATNPNQGTYYWTTDRFVAQDSAKEFFPNVEGVDVREGSIFFVSKLYKTLFILNLDNGTYTNHTTTRGLFDGEPDQMHRLVDSEEPLDEDEEILYFTEDGGTYAGIHARNAQSQYFTILETHVYADETTGLAFSPDLKFMYIAYQDNGIIFQIQRTDGLPFNAKTLNVKYHNTDTS